MAGLRVSTSRDMRLSFENHLLIPVNMKNASPTLVVKTCKLFYFYAFTWLIGCGCDLKCTLACFRAGG